MTSARLKFSVADRISASEKRRQSRSALADGWRFFWRKQGSIWAGEAVIQVAQLEYFKSFNEFISVDNKSIVRFDGNREIPFPLFLLTSHHHHVVPIPQEEATVIPFFDYVHFRVNTHFIDKDFKILNCLESQVSEMYPDQVPKSNIHRLFPRKIIDLICFRFRRWTPHPKHIIKVIVRRSKLPFDIQPVNQLKCCAVVNIDHRLSADHLGCSEFFSTFTEIRKMHRD